VADDSRTVGHELGLQIVIFQYAINLLSGGSLGFMENNLYPALWVFQ
jgi:hypothetical protein